jgi:hypothetical protein
MFLSQMQTMHRSVLGLESREYDSGEKKANTNQPINKGARADSSITNQPQSKQSSLAFSSLWIATIQATSSIHVIQPSALLLHLVAACAPTPL